MHGMLSPLLDVCHGSSAYMSDTTGQVNNVFVHLVVVTSPAVCVSFAPVIAVWKTHELS